MRAFLQILLFCVSALLLSYCSPLKGYKRQTIAAGDLPKSFLDQRSALLFKTKIDLGKRHYSGLLVAKYTSADTAHISFVTEIGMSIFDFILVKDQLYLQNIIAPLASPRLVQVLKKDMGYIFLQSLADPNVQMYTREAKTIFFSHQKENIYFSVEKNQVMTQLVKIRWRTRVLGKYGYSEDSTISNILLKRKGLVKINYTLQRIASEKP